MTMGHIQKRGPSRYRARHRGPDDREHSRTFTRRVDAERWLAAQQAALNRGEWTDPALGRTAFAEWASCVMAGRVHLKESTRARDEAVMRHLVLPHLGDRTLGGLLPADIQAWVAQLSADNYAPATVRKAYQLGAAVLTAAIESGLISRTPCRGIRLPRLDAEEMRFLTPDEIHHLANTVDPHYRALVLTVAYSGLRWGEAAALRPEDLNLLARTLTVTHTLSEVRGHLQVTEPKTPAARRTLALPASIAEMIGHHLAAGLAECGFVFTSTDGQPLRRTNFRRRIWLPAVTASVGEPCRFHDLRHSHVAMLIAHGEHPKTIAARLGHASVRTVLDVYGHLYQGLDQAAADRLDSIVSQQLAASPRPERIAAVRPIRP
jgi:integrase